MKTRISATDRTLACEGITIEILHPQKSSFLADTLVDAPKDRFLRPRVVAASDEKAEKAPG
jgi:hypothetical protein